MFSRSANGRQFVIPPTFDRDVLDAPHREPVKLGHIERSGWRWYSPRHPVSNHEAGEQGDTAQAAARAAA